MARSPFIVGGGAGLTQELLIGSTSGVFSGSSQEFVAQPVSSGATQFENLVFAEPQTKITGFGTPSTGGFFEGEINKLNLLGEYFASPPDPKKPSVPQVVVEPAEARSVFRSISVVDQYVVQAATGIMGLRETLRRPTGTPDADEDTLFNAIENYLDDYMTSEEINDAFPDRAEELPTFFPQDSARGDEGAPRFVRFALDDTELQRIRSTTTTPASGATPAQLQALHTNLFDAGRVIMDDARVVQRLRHGLVRLRRVRERDLERRREMAVELRTEIAQKRRALASLNGTRLEALGDAQAAQGLAAENWGATEAEYEARRRTLEENAGLAYVRVRETPVAVPFADPLPLRPDSGGPFPWEARIDADLPQALDPFFDVVLEIPISDWVALQDRIVALPAPGQLGTLAKRRSARLATMTAEPVLAQQSVLFQRLAPLKSVSQAVLSDLAALQLAPAASLKQQQQKAAEVLSLVDLLGGGSHRTRRPAEEHREALEQAILGLLGLLRQVSPGVRLAWGEAAEADTLAVREPGRWPALEAERDSNFNTLRSIFEVVEWWFDQLVPRPASASAAAMTSLMRAVLMLAADDDPAEILQGVVRVPPGRLDLGTLMRLRLNRTARPGAMLHLMDPSNVVVGLLRVDDEDAQGVTASVTQVMAQSVTVDTRFTVVERRLAFWD